MTIKQFSKKINYKKETDTMKNESAKKLLDFMKKSPTRYQVVASIIFCLFINYLFFY